MQPKLYDFSSYKRRKFGHNSIWSGKRPSTDRERSTDRADIPLRRSHGTKVLCLELCLPVFELIHAPLSPWARVLYYSSPPEPICTAAPSLQECLIIEPHVLQWCSKILIVKNSLFSIPRNGDHISFLYSRWLQSWVMLASSL